MSFYTINPVNEHSVVNSFHRYSTPIAYSKYEAVSQGTRSKVAGGCCTDDQAQVTQSKVMFCFSCMFDSRSIASSTLVGRDLSQSDIKHGAQASYRKSPAVNCYAFACGRVPEKVGDDPVPGAYFLEDRIRIGIVRSMALKEPGLPKSNPQLLQNKEEDVRKFLDKIGEDVKWKELASDIDHFARTVFNKTFNGLNTEEKTTFLKFLTTSFQIPPELMNSERLDAQLRLDGLIPIHNANVDKYEAGTHLLAAFVSPGNDYHFMRFFKEGWFERKGDILRLRGHIQPDKLFPIADKDSFQRNFCSNENGNDLSSFEFVGYYLVPPNAQLADKVGRNYILEGHRIAFRQGTSSSTSSVTSGSSGKFRSVHSRQPHASKDAMQGGSNLEETGAAAAAASSE